MIDFELILDIHVHRNKSIDRIIDQDLCFLCKKNRSNVIVVNCHFCQDATAVILLIVNKRKNRQKKNEKEM